MEQKVKTKVSTKAKEEIVEETTSTSHEELDSDVEDLLADIDDVLEANAETFVKSFIQKGGQ